MSAQHDVGKPKGPDLPREALLGRFDARIVDGAERAPSTPPLQDVNRPRRPAYLISLQMYLVLLFTIAAVLPVLVVFGVHDVTFATSWLSFFVDAGVWPVLVVAVAAGFGTMLGMIATHALEGPLRVLTSAFRRDGLAGVPVTLPVSEIREVAALTEALIDFRTRVAALTEVTGGQSVERRLGLSGAPSQRHELTARGPSDGLWDWDLGTNTLYCSPRWYELLGVRDGEDVVSPSAWFDRVHPSDLPQLCSRIDAHLRGRADHLQCESRLLRDDGTFRWTLCRGLALRRADGTPYRIAGSLTDMGDRLPVEERQFHDDLHDALTGMANRTLFIERLALAIIRTGRREAHRVAVVLLDVDRFKVVNDSLGHAVGDALLIAVSRRLEDCVRDVDTVARLGGDEWAILIDDIATPAQAIQVAERIQGALRDPLPVGANSLFVTVSIGVALLTDGTRTPEDLLRDAETAMYRAKELGRDRHVVFDASLHRRAVAHLALESDLRFALDRGELLVFYQPIVSADTLAVRGVEALLRWQHAERGLVPPADFVGVAEETGLILPLGEWVIVRAIEQMREWQAAGLAPERISVNLSARQLQQASLPERIAQMLDRAGLAPDCLELELTEGVVAEQSDAILDVLRRLRGLGVRLAVDDFGTGYSSLAYLTRFPVSTVKIDRSFLADIEHDTVNQAIVQAVTTLAHRIGMRVVAEGIETAEQHEFARSLGCDEVQGFLVSKPLSTDEATVWLGTQRGPAARRLGGRTPRTG